MRTAVPPPWAVQCWPESCVRYCPMRACWVAQDQPSPNSPLFFACHVQTPACCRMGRPAASSPWQGLCGIPATTLGALLRRPCKRAGCCRTLGHCSGCRCARYNQDPASLAAPSSLHNAEFLLLRRLRCASHPHSHCDIAAFCTNHPSQVRVDGLNRVGLNNPGSCTCRYLSL